MEKENNVNDQNEATISKRLKEMLYRGEILSKLSPEELNSKVLEQVYQEVKEENFKYLEEEIEQKEVFSRKDLEAYARISVSKWMAVYAETLYQRFGEQEKEKAVTELKARWKKVVGTDLGEGTRPLDWEGLDLIVEVDNASVLYTLESFMKDDLERMIQKETGYVLHSVKFVQKEIKELTLVE